jgi:hypothetical protein
LILVAVDAAGAGSIVAVDTDIEDDSLKMAMSKKTTV